MTARSPLTAFVAALALLAGSTAAAALWSATATGEAALGAATLANATDLVVACTTGAADSSVTLTWAASPDGYVDGYEVVRTAGADGAQATSTTGPGVTTTIDSPDVGDGQSYAYAIRARASSWTTPLLAATDVAAYTAQGCSPAPESSLGSFSVLAGAGGVTSTGATVLSGDLAIGPGGPLVGFPPGIVSGTTHLGDATALQAHADLTSAYDDAQARTATHHLSGDLGGQTLTAGVHHTSAALALTGTVTLDGQGDPDAVFVIQVGAALDTAAASTVQLINGAQATHVTWQVQGAVGLGAGTRFTGTILATGAITLGDSTQLTGRALTTAAVTLADTTIR